MPRCPRLSRTTPARGTRRRAAGWPGPGSAPSNRRSRTPWPSATRSSARYTCLAILHCMVCPHLAGGGAAREARTPSGTAEGGRNVFQPYRKRTGKTIAEDRKPEFLLFKVKDILSIVTLCSIHYCRKLLNYDHNCQINEQINQKIFLPLYYFNNTYPSSKESLKKNYILAGDPAAGWSLRHGGVPLRDQGGLHFLQQTRRGGELHWPAPHRTALQGGLGRRDEPGGPRDPFPRHIAPDSLRFESRSAGKSECPRVISL